MSQQLTLEASSPKTASGNSSETILKGVPNAASFELDVTAASTLVGDTIDVSIQTKVLNDWVDIVHFTQVLGNGGTKRFYAKVTSALAETMFENATALAAGAVRSILGVALRVSWTEVGTGSFTFSVVVITDTE